MSRFFYCLIFWFRSCAMVGKWKPGDSLTQYKEYERSAGVNG